YIASTRDCRACPLKPKCTPKMRFRRLRRDINEDARDVAPAPVGTPEFEKTRRESKDGGKPIAPLKTHHRFEPRRLRGLSGARDEFHLAAIVQNLKTLASRIWRPPPSAAAACGA